MMVKIARVKKKFPLAPLKPYAQVAGSTLVRKPKMGHVCRPRQHILDRGDRINIKRLNGHRNQTVIAQNPHKIDRSILAQNSNSTGV